MRRLTSCAVVTGVVGLAASCGPGRPHVHRCRLTIKDAATTASRHGSAAVWLSSSDNAAVWRQIFELPGFRCEAG